MILCYVCKTKLKNEEAIPEKHADGKTVQVCKECKVNSNSFQVDYFR